VPLLVSSCFVLLLHQFFSRGKLEIVPFHFSFFLLKAQTTKIDKEKAVFFMGELESKHGIFSKMPLAWYIIFDILSHNNRS